MVFVVSLIVFEVFLIANLRSGKTKSSSATVQSSVYNRAIESRNAAIQNLRLKLANTEKELAQEQQKFETSQANVKNLEKERDSLKKANENAESKLVQERQKVDGFQSHIMDLEQEMNDSLAIISTDIMNGETAVLVSTKAWKDRGDSNEIQQWKGLFSKIKNPLLRSQQERPNGDG